MNLLHAIILGIVEGVTEFLPISSTGHLILSVKVLGLLQSDFMKSFEIIIQLGAILSVIVLYWRSLIVDFKTFSLVFTGFVPTAFLGLLLYKCIKNVLLNNELIVLIALLAGGILLIVFELLHHEKPDASVLISDITYKQAFIIGVCQSAAIIPGVSRSLATILGGLALGLRRKVVVQFSFLLAIPTMLSATAYDLTKNASHFTSEQFYFLLVGFIVSFIVALFAIKFLISYIEKHNFIVFGIYRILIALLFMWGLTLTR
ncbi:MAG: undecaprenyl-diphosphatase UppP [bacterium]